jgi:gliding motility-associated-like protein
LGEGGTSNINIGTLSPPSLAIASINLTGIPFIPPAGLNSGINQDIIDGVIDPTNNDIYTCFNSFGGTPSVNNKIYKNNLPYSAASILWNVPSGLATLVELKNRPYLQPDNNGLTDNSANIFSLNPTYLFYWDGKNLKAFNKATGAGVGIPLITINTAKMSGGIYADACNNVYVGSVNGTIKVYNFNGSIFDDAPADITVAGYATKSVYDIAYNEADKLLYASGDGFVAAYDISATCPTNNVGFSLNIVANCTTASATANLVPSATTGSQVSYTLAIGSTVVATNSTGIFTGLLSLTNYKITATINPACSGIQVIGNFTLAGIAVPIVTTPIIYCQGATATALTATGTNLQWYTTATGGTGTTIAPIPSTTTVGTTAYYVSQSATAGSCESPRAQINVQVTTALAAPIVTTAITYCQGATATALTATGINLLWYTSASGGGTGTTTVPIPNTATLGTTAYYVSQSATVGSCESLRAQINVQVTTALAAPIITTPITYCQGATATALTAIGTNLLWYTSASGSGTGATTAPIPNTTTLGTTVYYVSQSATVGSCESPRAQINVQVIAALAAPIVTTAITYCQGATATALTATGTNLLWYTSASGGGIGTTTSPIPSTTTVGTTAYYVSQSSAVGGCESPRATINVNITPLLTANAGNTITIAAGTTTQLNATATAGADYTWSSNIAPISLSNINILNPIANPLQTTTYLLTVKDVLGNCPIVTSNVQVVVIGAQNCINIRNAFTPNGDGINDTWLVYDQDYCLAKDGASVKVFNRYGSKVYENNAYKNTWDGTYNNKPLPDGTYYAVIVFTLIDGSKQYARSDVTIIR